MQITPTQYIYPPRPRAAIPRDQINYVLGENSTWIAQLKYNDSRCMVKYLPGGKIELWNRHGEKFRNYTCPEELHNQLTKLHTTLNLNQDKISILDGGLLDAKHPAIKDTIVIWDILVHNGNHLLGTTYQERKGIIIPDVLEPWTHHVPTIGPITFGLKIDDNLFIPECHPQTEWANLWGIVDHANKPYTVGKPTDKNYKISPLLEGLVFKNPQGELSLGYKEQNNSDWIMRSRVHTGRHKF